jgi:hypothetical protein
MVDYIVDGDDCIVMKTITENCPVCLQEFTHSKMIWSINKGTFPERVIVCSEKCSNDKNYWRSHDTEEDLSQE